MTFSINFSMNDCDSFFMYTYPITAMIIAAVSLMVAGAGPVECVEPQRLAA